MARLLSRRLATAAGGRGKRRTDFGAPAAAIFGEKEEKIAHGGKIDGVNDGAAFASGIDQPGVRKHEQLGRHGVGGRGKPACDFARRQTLRSCDHQQAKDLEPGFLRQRRQPLEGIYRFHISTILELLGSRKPILAPNFAGSGPQPAHVLLSPD